ncbi:hypothetical protein D4Q76_01350 [archaeon]|nr:MAG: hypothetical protein D4Q76_01350 [archaeon]
MKIQLLKKLEEYPLFTMNEFVRITGKSQEYARTMIYRLKKEKLLYMIEKGKYTVHDDPMIFSSYIVIPSYISFWSGLRFHNLTEQLPKNIMIASAKPKHEIDFQGTKIRFFKTKQLWGYKKERYAGFDIFVAEKEKCIIDCLLLKNTPFDEVAKAVAKKELDEKKIAEYAVRTKNISLMKRLGYVMEYFGIDAETLTKYLDNNFIPLDWNAPKKGGKNKKWKITVNRRLDDIY